MSLKTAFTSARLCFRGLTLTLLVLAVMPLYGYAAAAQNRSPKLSYPDSALAEIDARAFGSTERSQVEAAVLHASGPQQCAHLVVMARYDRVLERNPLKAIAATGMVLWTREDRAEWMRRSAAAMGQMRKSRTKADGLAQPVRIEDCPHVDVEVLDVSTANVAIEYAHCLAEVGQVKEAFAITNFIGSRFNGVLRARASETLGDFAMLNRDHAAARDRYSFAVDVLDDHARYQERPLAPEEAYLRTQLLAKLTRVRQLLESDTYGEDWIAYRDADRLRLNDKNYLLAYHRFQQIIEIHPGTVFAGASECYSIDCLLSLADPAHQQSVRKSLDQARAALAHDRQELQRAVSRSLPVATADAFASAARDNEALVRSLQQIPVGSAAVMAAEKRIIRLMAGPAGELYGGEAIVRMGRHVLETARDPTRAEPIFVRAAEWCEARPEAPVVPPGFEVPAKCQAASAPPRDERVTDVFMNVTLVETKPGAIVNAVTCPWYVRRLHREALLKGGLAAYALGTINDAKRHWQAIYAIEPFYAESEAARRGSVVARLLWHAENSPG